MPAIKIYKSHTCPYCDMAVNLLLSNGVDKNDIEGIFIDEDPHQRNYMISITNRKTVPQIFIGDKHIGGYSDLLDLEKQGLLDNILYANKE